MSEQISETLVKLGLDYSSLFNVDQKTAMSRIQAALVGSVKPIRSDSGYDITEATIGQKATELGITTSVRNLNQMEKRLLRIIVLMDQMRTTGAMQDLARTIEQPANQIKVLKNQIQELGVWLGNVFIGTIGQILPYINGFVMALVQIIKTLAIFVGYTNTGSGLAEGLEEAGDASNNIASGFGSAAESAKELRRTIMGFDVLNNIQTPSASSGGGGGGSVDAIDPAILAALQDYDNLMGSVRMKAMDIRDRILEWLGFTLELDEAGNLVSVKLKDGYTKLDLILDAVKSIGTTFLGWKVSKAITTFMKNFGLLTKTGAFKASVALTLLITGISVIFQGMKNIIKGDLSPVNLLKGLLGSAVAGVGTALLTTNPIGWTVGIALALITAVTYIFKTHDKILKTLAEAEGLDYDGMSLIQKAKYSLDISLEFMGLKESDNELLIEVKDKITTWLSDLWTSITTWFNNVKKTISKWFSQIPSKVGYFLGVIVGHIANFFVNTIPDLWKKFVQWVKEIPEKIGHFFTVTIPEKWKQFTDWLSGLDEKLLQFGKDIIQGLIDGITEKWNELVTAVKDFFEGFIEGFKRTFEIHSPSRLFKGFGQNIIEGLQNGIVEKWNSLMEWWNNNGIKKWFDEKIKPWFSAEKWKGMAETATNQIKNTFTNLNIKIKTPHFSWTSTPATGWIASTLSALNLPTRIPKLNVSWYKDGGLPDIGELFVAREAGPELVGKMGSSNAVINNQQIIEGVSQGVANAVSSVLGGTGSSYQLFIDGEQITDVIQKRISRNANITGMAMGV